MLHELPSKNIDQFQHSSILSPCRPGAGHMPTYLAGREHEKTEFFRLLEQNTIFENLIEAEITMGTLN